MDPQDFGSLNTATADASLDDRIANYIYDSLLWIPSLNPSSGMSPQFGMNLYGITVFRSAGALAMQKIFEAWRDLFRMAPADLILTGQFTFKSGAKGSYERISVNQSLVLEDFTKVINLCDEATASDKEALILHLGI